MIKIIHVIIVIIFCNLSVNAQVKLYVSPTGNDSNPGTAEQPLASLTGARNAIRQYKKEHDSTVSFIVTISDGIYTLNEPFVLTPEDGGTPACPVIYKAEKDARPVFTGGRKITGFKVNKNGVWEVKIPGCGNHNRRFDQLYVNNKRATLARTPNTGFLKIGRVKENILEQGTGRVAKKAQQILLFDSRHLKFLQNLDDNELKLLRFRTYHKWDFTLRHVDKIKVEKDSLALFTSGKGMKPWNPVKKGGRIIFENFAAALDTAGEWFLNSKGILYYIPLPGQTPENTVVTAPVLENLIDIKGDIPNNKFVEYIKFEGLTFKYCNYRIPQTGFEPNQAAVSINSAVMLRGVKHITFKNCEISNTGQHALWFKEGCSHSLVDHCFFHDLGGGGIYLGGVAGLKGMEHTHNIKLNNNIIHSGGREFPPSVGIWTGHSSDIEITHNDIADFYYTGISVGWVWGYKPSLAKRNRVAYNHVHHIGWDLLSDMAAIYTLGESEGTVINNNVVDHIHAYSYGGWGLYADEGSSGIVMENNLVYSTKTGGFHQNYGKDNTIRNNIFAYSKLYQLQCTRAEKHRSFDFTNNIIVFDEGAVLNGAWNKINIFMDYNIYWNTRGNTYDFCGHSFKEWQQSGHDVNSFIINPDFNDAPHFDFTFKNNKSIRKINFKPFDYSKAGVYGDKGWIKKATLSDSVVTDFEKAVEKNMHKSQH
jgi:hypothetical protein